MSAPFPASHRTTFTDKSPVSAGAAFYRVGTGLTNEASAPVLEGPAWMPGSVTLTWASVTNRSYSVERATDVAGQVFSVLGASIPGLPGTTGFTDTNPPASGPAFYRVGVQQ